MTITFAFKAFAIHPGSLVDLPLPVGATTTNGLVVLERCAFTFNSNESMGRVVGVFAFILSSFIDSDTNSPGNLPKVSTGNHTQFGRMQDSNWKWYHSVWRFSEIP